MNCRAFNVLYAVCGWMGRSREKAIAFVGICAIAVVVVLKNVSVLHSRGSLVQGRREQPVEKVRCVFETSSILLRRM